MIIEEFRPPFMEGHLGDELTFNIEENDAARDSEWANRNIGTYKNSILSVPDIGIFIDKVKQAGGSVTKEPTKMPWGYLEAHVTDLDGNTFIVEQLIPNN